MNRIAAVCVLLVVIVSAGCVRFPYGRSADRHNYLSTAHQPLSLSVSDTLTGETVWTLDVPVNKMAVVDFEHKTDWTPGQSPALPAEKIYWDIFDPGAVLGALRHEQDLSGRPVILRVSVREKDAASADTMRPATTRPAMMGAPMTPTGPMTPTTTPPGAALPPPATTSTAAPARVPAPAPAADAPAAIPSGPAVDRPDQRR